MYAVGDIVWVVNSSYPGVKPYQVVEETTHKTLKGTMKTFYVREPSNNSDPVTIDNLGGEIFTSVESVQQELNARAQRAIEKMINQGKVLISKHFVTKVSLGTSEIAIEQDEVPPALLDSSIINKVNAEFESGEDNFVILPDGTRARINIKGNIL
jgi:hypothetical protein